MNIISKTKFENIPNELKELPQWVCWKHRVTAGKREKRPIDPKTGGWASIDKLSSWSTFDIAVGFFRNHADKGIEGIGFAFSVNDSFCGIDIDNCLDPKTGQLTAFADKIVRRFNSYTEVSPSEEGVHIIIKGKLPHGGKKGPQGVEVYDLLRFFTMTGNTLDGFDTIHDRQTQLDALMKKHFNQTPSENSNVVNFPRIQKQEEIPTNDEIIQEIKNFPDDNKYKQIWNNNWKMLATRPKARLIWHYAISLLTVSVPIRKELIHFSKSPDFQKGINGIDLIIVIEQ